MIHQKLILANLNYDFLIQLACQTQSCLYLYVWKSMCVVHVCVSF